MSELKHTQVSKNWKLIYCKEKTWISEDSLIFNL